MKDSQKYMAEFLGTVTLVFIACGVAVVSGGQYLPTALAFGLVVLAMVYAIGPISGCHINPAISVAMLVAGKMKAKDCLMYIIAQFLGAIVGAALLMAIANGLDSYSLETSGLGQNGYGDDYSGYALGAAFLAEVLLTAIFLFVIFGSTSKAAPKGFAGMAIGFSLTFVHLVGIPDYRDVGQPGQELRAGNSGERRCHIPVWVFLVAPILGGVVAALIWKLFFDSAGEEAAPPA